MEKQYTLAEKVVQQQLDAYNQGNLEAFANCYAEDVLMYNFPENEAQLEGKKRLEEIYQTIFAKSPNLHCELRNRIVLDNQIIDHESITGMADKPTFEAVAIYRVSGDKITHCWFMYPDGE
ncbi:hypothetical protein BKI52_02160 [marine bacterium AO1-C]|nr:hypothetical protein BKI52_02160 [marine bacterium AO1-C]